MENQPPYQRRHHAIDLTLIAVASILVIFTFAVITVYTSFLVACIACGSLGLIAIGIWRYPPHHKHHHEINMERRQQKLVEDAFQLTKELTLQHHFSSSLKLADGREWHWDSPWCVPDGPLTIKDNQFGLPQIAGAAPLPGPCAWSMIFPDGDFLAYSWAQLKAKDTLNARWGAFCMLLKTHLPAKGKPINGKMRSSSYVLTKSSCSCAIRTLSL